MKFLDKNVFIYSLVFFRIMFGILAFAESIALLFHYHWKKNAYEYGGFQFKYFGFEWVQPLPYHLMNAFFIFLIISAALIALGKWYRWAATFFAFGITYVFLLEKSYYLNHGYLLCMLSFLIVLLPLNKYLSLDVWKNPSIRQLKVPYWNLLLLNLMMGIVYFYGGLAKINWDWLNARPLERWVSAKSDMYLLGPLWAQDWVPWVMSYGGLMLDLFIVPLLIFSRPTRWLALTMAVFFHIVNTILFNIGIFPILSITLTLLFFEPDFPLKVINWLKLRIPFVGKLQDGWNRKMEASPQFVETIPSTPKVIFWGLGIYIVIQLLIPFRHHLIAGDVAWTEEGHRFSWRMMLRSKRGSGHFKVADLDKNKVYKVYPKKELTKRQAKKIFAHPDMIYQFVQKLKKDYRAKGIDNIAITAHVKAKLNGGKKSQYIDPEVDLSKVEWKVFGHNEWILPRPE